jgi:hypothetical protein
MDTLTFDTGALLALERPSVRGSRIAVPSRDVACVPPSSSYLDAEPSD